MRHAELHDVCLLQMTTLTVTSAPGCSHVLHLASADEVAPLFSDEWLGSEVWPAARSLVRLLERDEWQARLRGALSVVELGSGTGAVGLAASVLGAPRVLLTDLPTLLPTLQHNCSANRLAGTVECAALPWVSRASELPLELAPAGSDLILGSDLLNPVYGDEHAERLAATVAALLARCPPARQPVALLAQVKRGKGVAERQFFAACRRFGLNVATETRADSHDAQPTQILRLSLASRDRAEGSLPLLRFSWPAPLLAAGILLGVARLLWRAPICSCFVQAFSGYRK